MVTENYLLPIPNSGNRKSPQAQYVYCNSVSSGLSSTSSSTNKVPKQH